VSRVNLAQTVSSSWHECQHASIILPYSWIFHDLGIAIMSVHKLAGPVRCSTRSSFLFRRGILVWSVQSRSSSFEPAKTDPYRIQNRLPFHQPGSLSPGMNGPKILAQLRSEINTGCIARGLGGVTHRIAARRQALRTSRPD